MSRSGRRPALLDLFQSSLLLNRLITRELAQLGLRAEFFGLLTLLRALGPVTPTTLAQETGIALTTLSDYVQTLVRRGHVRREPNPRDRRSYLLALTPKGREFLDRAAPAVQRTKRLIDANLDRPPGEVDEIVADLNRALQRALASESRAR